MKSPDGVFDTNFVAMLNNAHWGINFFAGLRLCCEDVIKSKQIYTVLIRSTIRPKHVYAVT